MNPAEPLQLHDFGPRARLLRVDVHRSSLFDLLLSLWSSLGADDKAAAHDLGTEWFETFRTSIDGELWGRMQDLGGDDGKVWVVVAGMLTQAPAPSSADDLLAMLEATESHDLRRALVSELTWDVDPGLVDRVAAAEPGAVEELAAMSHIAEHPRKAEAIRALLGENRPDLPRKLAGVLRDLWSGPFGEYADAWRPAIDRSAQATRLLIATLEPGELIETVTNGISYEIPLGITRLVLVPSVSIRPWTLVTEHERSLIVFYPVADEHLDADPDAPPGWLVRFHKALGDERRLRILREVTAGEPTLADLTEILGLAKSTVFHHVGVLRGAGLVRVRMGGDQTPSYALREGAISDAHRALVGYLTSTSTNGGSR